MEKVSTYVGLDVHKRDIVVAVLRAGEGRGVGVEGT